MYSAASEEFKKKGGEGGVLPLGQVLKGRLEGRSLSQVAREAGVDRAEIYHILSGRKKYPGLESLRKLARYLGLELWQLVAQTEASRAEAVYAGGQDPHFTMQFKKEGVLLSSDIPPNRDLFVGRILLDPRAQLADHLTGDCLIYLRPVAASLEVTVAGKTHRLAVNHKLLFNGRLPHSFRNPNPSGRATALFITTPAFWSLRVTR